MASQGFVTHFLPPSHPSEWLDACFSLWESFNSALWDANWLDFTARLSEIHLDAKQSHPDRVELLRGFEKSWPVKDEDMLAKMVEIKASDWSGIRKDVGIYTTLQWNAMMAKILKIMKIPVGRVAKVISFAMVLIFS